MADIILAEYNGGFWLVGGETHLHPLLGNTLADDISIEILQCERVSDVTDLWAQFCGKRDTGGMPWQIHPNIVARIRRRSADYAVFFAQWSVLLDRDALTVISAAADWARQNPAMPLLLAQYFEEDAPQSIADLAKLRTQLIADKLAEAGIGRDRISLTRRAIDAAGGMTQESQRVDIVGVTA